MAFLIDEKRRTSPTSSAQVSARIGPTAGIVMSRSIRSRSLGSRSSERNKALSVLPKRTTVSWHIRSKDAVPRRYPGWWPTAPGSTRLGVASVCCSSPRLPSARRRPYSSSAPPAGPANSDNAACAVARESPWRPCKTQEENHSADSRQSCGRRYDRSSFLPPQWPAASADATFKAAACGFR